MRFCLRGFKQKAYILVYLAEDMEVVVNPMQLFLIRALEA
jgi:hypothetical protein